MLTYLYAHDADMEAAKDLIVNIKKQFPGKLDEPMVKQACNAVRIAQSSWLARAYMHARHKYNTQSCTHTQEKHTERLEACAMLTCTQ
jgi:hypothetical protein